MTTQTGIKGYKVFNKDWTCRGFQYEVGKEYTIKESPVLCEKGFHFCEKLVDCFGYYSFNPENKVAEVLATGECVKDADKTVTNTIIVIKELTWMEVLTLVNTGKDNTGNRNSGNWNSGDWNSGNWNSGNWNSGDWNSGNWNSGNWNSGNWNSGNLNSGNWNSGNRNSGNWNSGNRNSGNWNSGNRNSGNWNSGNWNSGNLNSGNWNSGDWNSGDLNSTTPDVVRFFNVFIPRQIRDNAKIPDFFYKVSCNVFVFEYSMTEQEKKDNPNWNTVGGYLKKVSYKEAWKYAYACATEQDKALIKLLPNFDSDVFFDITGLRII